MDELKRAAFLFARCRLVAGNAFKMRREQVRVVPAPFGCDDRSWPRGDYEQRDDYPFAWDTVLPCLGTPDRI
jgi:hypothetical protein